MVTSWTRPGILDPDRREEAHDYLVEYFTGTAYSGSYFDGSSPIRWGVGGSAR